MADVLYELWNTGDDPEELNKVKEVFRHIYNFNDGMLNYIYAIESAPIGGKIRFNCSKIGVEMSDCIDPDYKGEMHYYVDTKETSVVTG